MVRAVRFGKLSFLVIPIVAGGLLVSGCTGTNTIVINETDWEDSLSQCSALGRPIRACALKERRTCTVVVPEGHPDLLAHELSHCHDGAFHS